MTEQVKHLLRPLATPVISWYYNKMGQFFPKRLANIQHKRAYGKPIDWQQPKDINEKINWLKFYSDTSQWTVLADKYRVREYVEKCGLADMLVKLYGKWDRAEDIDWPSLPKQFIMKTNNGSGEVLICTDKETLDIPLHTQQFKRLLKEKFGNNMAEPHYNKIKPCIIAEELLDCKHQAFESSSLIDYKIWAFEGKPAYIWVCYNRTHHSVVVATYDLDWNFHPEYSISNPHYVLSDKTLPKPKSLDKMLEAAAILSKGFPELRVDLYEVDDKPYFGEMTFSAAAGLNYFYTQEFLDILGEKADLGIAKRKK